MQPWTTAVLNTLLPSLVVAAFTSIVTVQLALRRFRAERWWERQADAYSRIVEALHVVMGSWYARLQEERTGQALGAQPKQRLSDDYDRAARELEKATDIGAYIISERVVEALTRFQRRQRLDPDNSANIEIYEDEYRAYKKVLAEIKKLAKEDLGV